MKFFSLIILVILIIPIMVSATNNTEPIYADKNFIEVNYREYNEEYGLISAETREGSGMDWYVYVVRLEEGEIENFDDYYQVSSDKRSVFESEDEVVEILYAPAKSFFRKLNVGDLLVDAVCGLMGGPMVKSADSVAINKEEKAVYLIRAYSGALGLRDDKEERNFVKNSIDEGKDRNRMAFNLNLVTFGFDTFNLFYDTGSLGDGAKVIVSKAAPKIITRLSIYDEDGNLLEGMLETVRDIGDIVLKEQSDYLVSFTADAVQVKTLSRFSSFISNVSKAALSVVELSGKISKGGEILNRVYDFAYAATPLETAYIANTDFVEDIEEKIDEEEGVEEESEKSEENMDETEELDDASEYSEDSTGDEGVDEIDDVADEVYEAPVVMGNDEKLGNASKISGDIRDMSGNELNRLADNQPADLAARLINEGPEIIIYVDNISSALERLINKGYAKTVVGQIIKETSLKEFGGNTLNDMADHAPAELTARLSIDKTEEIIHVDNISSALERLIDRGYAKQVVNDVIDVVSLREFGGNTLNDMADHAPAELYARLLNESAEIIKRVDSYSSAIERIEDAGHNVDNIRALLD